MPSQSSCDGESMPDHLMVIGSPDLGMDLELREIEIGDEDEN